MGWNAPQQSMSGDEVLAAALEETEAKASALDLENARLRLALVIHRARLGIPDARTITLGYVPAQMVLVEGRTALMRTY